MKFWKHGKKEMKSNIKWNLSYLTYKKQSLVKPIIKLDSVILRELRSLIILELILFKALNLMKSLKIYDFKTKFLKLRSLSFIKIIMRKKLKTKIDKMNTNVMKINKRLIQMSTSHFLKCIIWKWMNLKKKYFKYRIKH